MNKQAQIKEIESLIKEVQDEIQPKVAQIASMNSHRKSIIADLEKEIMEDPRNAEFIAKCEELNAEFVFANYRADFSDSITETFEDDGSLHIQKGNISGCFICNQDIRKAEWNKQARPIMKAFGIPFSSLR